jgi:hypothetical protein
LFCLSKRLQVFPDLWVISLSKPLCRAPIKKLVIEFGTLIC